jgi:GxxExxY protein
MGELLFRDEVYAIVGAAFEVHKELGPGFLEAVYQEALAIELVCGIPFDREMWMLLWYKKRQLKKRYKADFVCYDKIVVELKALAQLSGERASEDYQLSEGIRNEGRSFAQFRPSVS